MAQQWASVGLALPMLAIANFGDEEPRGRRRV